MKEKNVQPLRTSQEIEDMRWALSKVCSERDKFMFSFGINVGLRVSDIVPLKVKDVLNKTHIIVREKKTQNTRSQNKVNRFLIPMKLREEIEDYTRKMDLEDYLFSSKKGGHISATQAYRALVKAGELLGREDIGTHTMRKTFGYFHYRKNKDLAILQAIFGHSSPSITKLYIGIRREEIDSSLKDFYL